MKKITAILGSPNENSQTEDFIKKVLRKLFEVKSEYKQEIIKINKYNILACRGCKRCFDDGRCILCKDDRMDTIIEKIKESDIVLWATPSYLNHIPGSMKNFLDRLAVYTHNMAFAGKLSFIFVTASHSGTVQITDYLNNILTWMGFKILCNFSYIENEYISKEESINNMFLSMIRNVRHNYGYSDLELERKYKKLKDIIIFDDKNLFNGRFEYEYWNQIWINESNTFQDYANKIRRDYNVNKNK